MQKLSIHSENSRQSVCKNSPYLFYFSKLSVLSAHFSFGFSCIKPFISNFSPVSRSIATHEHINNFALCLQVGIFPGIINCFAVSPSSMKSLWSMLKVFPESRDWDFPRIWPSRSALGRGRPEMLQKNPWQWQFNLLNPAVASQRPWCLENIAPLM